MEAKSSFSVIIPLLSVAMGFVFPKFDASNPADIETSWGGIIYMVYSFFYISLTLSLEAAIARIWFVHYMKTSKSVLPQIASIAAVILLLNIAVVILSYKSAVGSIRKMEFTA